MKELSGIAHAKLNLTLDVIRKRNDGFHDLCMVMQEISLGDQISLAVDTNRAWELITQSGEVPCDDSNIAVRAAKLFFSATGIKTTGLCINLQKVTPVCAGLGGGSADGALVLALLQKYYDYPLDNNKLYALAEQIGSDVPFALFGGTALAEGKGERLTRMPDIPQCTFVLCKPAFPVATPTLFRAIDEEKIIVRPDTGFMCDALSKQDLCGISDALCNVFEPLVSSKHSEIEHIRSSMLTAGALNACMSGSGPTMFAVFSDTKAATKCFTELKAIYEQTYLTVPVSAMDHKCLYC